MIFRRVSRFLAIWASRTTRTRRVWLKNGSPAGDFGSGRCPSDNLFDNDEYLLPGHFSNLVFPGPPLSLATSILKY